ncbi:aldehyde dehydrogenase family protein [Schinkia azotoformans]|uniref:aldehyde dehydrogenase family protein n=1 Tax=Schinkia azotoformans TaxID=1454 RepID=UPI002DB96A1F|nr:aldehyde dehydrogenase family protein [Schinkia azotoformans]MEC1721758.1 aldehyde dehydrogenase family protein [Schinkia azotoformans]MED4414978.1 aldehyde dehydrogenase family protein [Schinkia azotoformans]
MSFDQDLQSIQEMRNALTKAHEAQKVFATFTQQDVDRIVKQVADAAFRESKRLADMAVEETGMGIAVHKKIKNEVSSRDVYESIKNEKTIGIIHCDHALKVTEIAYPFGVVAAIIPTTNPTSTAIYKTLISLKSGNGIVASPHPRATNCTIEALKICNEAAIEAGAPQGLIGWISKPTIEATQLLMNHKLTNVILATGGVGLVRAAYSSGKPAYGVGPGNVPAYIEKTANVANAVKNIVDSKTFDNGTICASEQAIVVDQNVKEMTIREFKKNKAYFVEGEEKVKMEKIISPVIGQLNPNIVGHSAVEIAKMAGINVPADTRVIIAEEDRLEKSAPFSIEKLSPILALYTAPTQNRAKEICLGLLNLGGRGHSLSIHTNDEQIAEEYAQIMPVSRIMVNTLSSIGAVGATTGLKPSFTLGCGSYGGNITGDNISARHLINIKRLAYVTKEVLLPQESERPKDSLSNEGDHVENVVSKVLESMKIEREPIDVKEIKFLVQKVVSELQR